MLLDNEEMYGIHIQLIHYVFYKPNAYLIKVNYIH